MEVEETTEQTVDEVIVPAELEESQEQVSNATDETGASDEITPETSETGEKVSGFKSLFQQAKQTALKAEDSEETDEVPIEETAEETKSDDKIPDAETPEAEEIDETESDGEQSDEENKDPETKKTPRSQTFNEMKDKVTAVEVENTELKTRIDTLDSQFEKHGGVEAVETAMELFDLASDKTKASEFVEKINSLPHKGLIQKEIFEKVLDLPANRVYGINRVLTEDFGLETSLTEKRLEKIFEFVTTRLNADEDDFDNFLERELELTGDREESEILRLRAENERLKNPPKTEETPNDALNQESEIDFANRIQKTYNTFEDQTFAKVSATELDKYGFSINQNDTPEVKGAKTFLANAVKYAVAVEMREAKAHESLLDFWIEKTPEETNFYKQAKRGYENAMTIKVQKALKNLAPLLGAKGKVADEKQKLESTVVKAAQNSGRSTVVNPPKKDAKPQGFGSAFQNARKATER